MKIIKLSLIASLTISSAIAGGDIVPMPPPLVEERATTVSGKLQAYYYTFDNFGTGDLFSDTTGQLGTAVTLDISHKLFEGVTLNFSATGFSNLMDKGGYMEGTATGGYMNIANITASYWDTTLIAGRQLLDTPMLGSFDWLLAPSSFEAVTIKNNSIENLTLVTSYVTKIRENNDWNSNGNTFTDLTANSQNNYAVGAVYANENLFDASVWYYNIDSSFATANLDKYTQIYTDLGISYAGVKLEGQYVMTDYAGAGVTDASAFGAKLSTTIYDIALSAAYVQVVDNVTGYVGVDSLYTSSWNTFASWAYDSTTNKDASTYKVDASTKIYGVDMEVSYAGYNDKGSEVDVILGYDVTDAFSLGAIYTSTDYDTGTDFLDADNAIEIIATYTF
ncbi:MAG: OprD family outer membrane porin [Sulfurovum sp.]